MRLWILAVLVMVSQVIATDKTYYLNPSGIGTTCSSAALADACDLVGEVFAREATVDAENYGATINIVCAPGTYPGTSTTFAKTTGRAGRTYIVNSTGVDGVIFDNSAAGATQYDIGDTAVEGFSTNLIFNKVSLISNYRYGVLYLGLASPVNLTFTNCPLLKNTADFDDPGFIYPNNDSTGGTWTFTNSNVETPGTALSLRGTTLKAVVNGGSFKNTRNIRTLYLLGTSNLSMTGTAVSNTGTGTTGSLLQTAGTGHNLRLTDCTFTAPTDGTSGFSGIFLGTSSATVAQSTYIKGCDFTVPGNGLVAGTNERNLIVEDCDVSVSYPAQLTIAGTWATGEKLGIYVTRGTTNGKVIVTVGATTTVTALCAAVEAAWNASTDPVVSEISLTNNDPVLQFAADDGEPWAMWSDAITTSGTRTQMWAYNGGAQGTWRPGTPITDNGIGSIYRNCTAWGRQVSPYEAIAFLRGFDLDSNHRATDCVAYNAVFGVANRSRGNTFERLRAIAPWPFLAESSSARNTVSHSTLYATSFPMSVSTIAWDDLGAAETTPSYLRVHDSILVADATNPVTSANGTVHTVSVYRDYGSLCATCTTTADRNLLWTIGDQGHLAFWEPATAIDVLANVWTVAVGAQQMNDANSQVADPLLLSTTPGQPFFLEVPAGSPAAAGRGRAIGGYQPAMITPGARLRRAGS